MKKKINRTSRGTCVYSVHIIAFLFSSHQICHWNWKQFLSSGSSISVPSLPPSSHSSPSFHHHHHHFFFFLFFFFFKPTSPSSSPFAAIRNKHSLLHLLTSSSSSIYSSSPFSALFFRFLPLSAEVKEIVREWRRDRNGNKNRVSRVRSNHSFAILHLSPTVPFDLVRFSYL